MLAQGHAWCVESYCQPAAVAGVTVVQTVAMPHVLSLFQLAPPDHYDRWRQRITLALSPVRLGRNPLLAGLKHLNRLEQVLIRSRL